VLSFGVLMIVKSRNILIVEDDRSIREMMKSILEIEGYSVSLAANGQEGMVAI